MQNNNIIKTITLGGGCFWCTEAIFDSLKGVLSVKAGYAGGDIPHPTYEDICTGTTNHAEVIQIEYNAENVSLEILLTIFFDTHNPTTLNRQGADVGTQYRSVVFYHNEDQKDKTIAFIKELTDTHVFEDTIVTEVTEINNYYPAEDYHQNYYENNKNKGYCRMVINPKMKKLKEKYSTLLKD